MQHTSNTTTDSGPVATRTRSQCNAAVPQPNGPQSVPVNNTDSTPMSVLAQIKAAIPEQGIKGGELHRQFRQFVTPREFVEIAYEVGRWDSATRLIYPRSQ